MSSAAPPLRIAYVVDEYLNPENVTSWSGLPSFMFSALGKQAGVQLTTVVVRDRPREAWEWIKFLFHRFVFRTRYLRDRHGALLRSYGRQIERHLATSPTDLVFCPGSLLLAGLQTNIPAAFWVDATFGGMREFYGSFSNLSKVSIREGNRADEEAIRHAALAIYSSEWAAQSAIKYHGADPAKVRVRCRSGPTCRRSRATRK